MQSIEQEMARFAEDASFAVLWASIKELGKIVVSVTEIEKLKGYPTASKSPEFPLFLLILSEAGTAFVEGNEYLAELEAKIKEAAESRSSEIREKYKKYTQLHEANPEATETKEAASELEKLKQEHAEMKELEQEKLDSLRKKLLLPFHRQVEQNLATLFPSRATQLPEAVGELAFYLFATVYGERDEYQLRNGLTIIDHYFDLTIEDISHFASKQSNHFTGFAETCGFNPQNMIQWGTPKSNQSARERNEEFFLYKWKLLKEVFSIQENDVCPYPGVFIIDSLLDALEANEPTIRNVYPDLTQYFPIKPFVTPLCMQKLSDILHDIDPRDLLNNYGDILTSLPCGTAQDKMIIKYLLSYCQALTKDSLEDIAQKTTIFGKEKQKYEGLARICSPYIFFQKLCQITSFFSSKFSASKLLGKFFEVLLSQNTCETLLGRCSVIVDQELEIDTIQEKEKTSGNKKYKRSPPAALLDNPTLSKLSENHCNDIGCILALTGLSVQDLNRRFNQFIGNAKNARKEKASIEDPEHLILFFQGLLPHPQQRTATSKTFNIKKIEQSPTCGALLLRHYRFQALNHIIYQEIHLIDPVISDTLCEIRPSFLVDCDIIIQDALKSGEKFKHLTEEGLQWKKQIINYNKIYNKLPWDESHINMMNPEIFLGESCVPYIYIEFCRCLEEELVAKGDTYYPRYLTLCKMNTRTSFLIRDRMNIEMGEDSITIMPGKEKNRRRSEMGFYNTLYVKKAAMALRTVELPNSQSLINCCPALDMTIQSIVNCHVVTPSNDIQVVPIYQAQMFSFLKMFSLGRPLIVKLKRIHITEKFIDDHKDYPNDKSKGDVIENAVYKVVGSKVFIYQPNYETGRFTLIPESEEGQWANVLGMAISAYSILDLTDPEAIKKDPGFGKHVDEGYYTEDPKAYFDFFKTQDILNLLNACSANHPVFLSGAKGIDDHGYITLPLLSYNKESEFWSELHNKKRNKIEIEKPFTLLLDLYNQKDKALKGECTLTFGAETSLYFDNACDDFINFFRLGEVLGLSNKQYKSGRLKELKSKDNEKTFSCSDTTIIYRFIGCMPFYSIHIYGSSLAIERVRLERGMNNVSRFEDENEMLQRAIQASFEEYNNSLSMKNTD